MRLRLCGAAVVMLLLSGCLTTYTPPDSGSVAMIKIKHSAVATICVNNEQTRLKANRDGYAAVPAGKEIRIGAQYSYEGAYTRVICIPVVKFTPIEGAKYVHSFKSEGYETNFKCAASIHQETDQGLKHIADNIPGSFGCQVK
jgi:hypothetical protein